MQAHSLPQKMSLSQLLQGLLARVGKHGCDAAWQALASSDVARYAFLLKAPSDGGGTTLKSGRLVRLQSLNREGLELEWMAADDSALDTSSKLVSGAGRWVLRTITVYGRTASRSDQSEYYGELPFGLRWNSDFAQAQALLGHDHTQAPNDKQPRSTFFLADGRSVEIVYYASLRTIVRINVSFLGTSVPCA